MDAKTRNAIEELLRARHPYAEIAAKYKISSKTIATIARESGFVRRNRKSRRVNIVSLLALLYEFVESCREYVDVNPAIAAFMAENSTKLDEIKKLIRP